MKEFQHFQKKISEEFQEEIPEKNRGVIHESLPQALEEIIE